MNRKRLLFVLLASALGAGTLALGRQGQSAQAPRGPAAQEQQPEVPDHITYRHLFNHVNAFKKEAEKAEREGKDPEPFRGFFRRKAGLSEAHARDLEEVATQFAQEAGELDARARAVVREYLKQYPNGQVPYGETPAPRPPGLREMAEQRDAMVLRYRDRLRLTIGEQEFVRFHGFIKRSVAPNVQLSVPGHAAPAPQEKDGQPSR